MEQLKKSARLREKYLKEALLFRLQATDIAMIQTKIKSQIDVERACMTLAEMESTLMNLEKSDEQL